MNTSINVERLIKLGNRRRSMKNFETPLENSNVESGRARIRILETGLSSIEQKLNRIDFCCGWNDVIDEIREEIKGLMEGTKNNV